MFSDALAFRLEQDPIAHWCARHLTEDTAHPTPEMHLDIYELLRTTQRHVVMAPRSYAKSTLVSKNLALYLICELDRLRIMDDPPIYPHDMIILCSATKPLAKKWMMDIQRVLTENEAILTEYGDLSQGAVKWNSEEIKLKNGMHIRACGTGSQMRGWRPTLFIGDDLDDDQEVQSDERIEKRCHWWDTAVTNMLDEVHCQCFVIGTTIEEVTLLQHIADKPNWESTHFAAYRKGVDEVPIEQEGYETWPSKWPKYRLDEREGEIGRKAFRAEFLCDPMSTEAPIFERRWFREYDHTSPGFEKLMEAGVYTLETVDPAISRQDAADFTAIVTASITHEFPPRIFIRVEGVKQGHWSVGRQVTEIVNMYDKFFVRLIGIETVAYQAALAQEVETYRDAEVRDIKVRQLLPDGDKERRANAVAPIVERGLVYVDYSDPTHKKLVDQCVRFKPGKKNIKKDIMDAFVYMLMVAREWSRSRQEAGARTVLPRGARRSEYTGIIT